MTKLEQAYAMMRNDLCVAAAGKLGRPISDEERSAIVGIDSMMMLESVERSWTSESYESSSVLADLDHFRTHLKE